MNTENNKLKGKLNSSVGAVKQAAGKIINDKKLEDQGLVQKEKGYAQITRGTINEKLSKTAHAVGDAVEKVGRKIGRLAD